MEPSKKKSTTTEDEDEDDRPKSNNNNTRKGAGVRLRNDTVEYRGGLDENGLFHGLGLLRTVQGSPPYYYFYGDWVHGRPNGKAVVFDGANIYEGDVLENSYAMGTKWFQWQDSTVNIEHGRGVNIYLEGGDWYEGDFNHGKVTGHGTYHWQDTRYQVCTFIDNVANGKGEYHWPGGIYFEGFFVNEDRTGEGTLHLPDGTKLIANYVNDLRKGAARAEWPNGDVWEGEFLTHTTAKGKRTFASSGDTLEGLFWDYELKNGGKEEEGEWMTYRRVMENGEVEEKLGVWQNEVFIERKQ